MKSSDEQVIEIPIEHQELVLKRLEEAMLNPEIMLNWDEASKTLKS